ncbi:MAG: ankyrin repeat domain-containing protein [Proteobacteria bacterium]|nr:ankyrin repeat domain-containing protein [Pseudomonadota bacterium]MBU1687883.1 ankyrin repeat domain-containing protein [Pseudomonadota bacterium]
MGNRDEIHKAAYNGNIAEVERILKTHPDPDARDSSGGTALHAAMFQNNLRIITLLIEHNFDVNAVGPHNGYTPLHDAVWADNLEAIKILRGHGARTDVSGKDSLTPYGKAKEEGKAAIVKYFESQGITS